MKKNTRADFGIINFWWCDDHGAILTAFALQQFLKNEGYSSELIKCWRDYDEKNREGGISWLFEKQYMKSSPKIYRTYDDIFGLTNNIHFNEDYTGFITGSDQVFRPEYVPDSWYLTFVNGKGKIAVAASFGTDEFICDDENRFERICESMKSFDHISIREDSGVKLCRDYFNVDAFHLLDPVFLVDRKEYDRIIYKSEIKMKKEFIFCYIRDLNKNIAEMIDNIKDQHHIELIWCSDTMSVEDFLYYVSNCKFMITDSYHGLCFSIIFNKDYLCIRNTMRGRARFDSLKIQLELSDENFIDENEQADNIALIDYFNINEKIRMLCEEGRAWLKYAIDDTYRKYR